MSKDKDNPNEVERAGEKVFKNQPFAGIQDEYFVEREAPDQIYRSSLVTHLKKNYPSPVFREEVLKIYDYLVKPF